MLMEPAQRGRQPDGNAQKPRKLQGPIKNPIERLTTQVLKDEHCPLLVANQFKR
jgi:hypothetical protein